MIELPFKKIFCFFEEKYLHFGALCAIISKRLKKRYAPIAQLDRVTGYEPVGRGFESLSAYQKYGEGFCLPHIFVYAAGLE